VRIGALVQHRYRSTPSGVTHETLCRSGCACFRRSRLLSRSGNDGSNKQLREGSFPRLQSKSHGSVRDGLQKMRPWDYNHLHNIVHAKGSALSSGSSVWLIWMRPVFRSGRNPTLRLFLSCKIANVRIRAIARSYCHEPSAGLVHFCAKFLFFSHRSLCTQILTRRHHRPRAPSRNARQIAGAPMVSRALTS
jgi:hypothetical protein